MEVLWDQVSWGIYTGPAARNIAARTGETSAEMLYFIDSKLGWEILGKSVATAPASLSQAHVNEVDGKLQLRGAV